MDIEKYLHRISYSGSLEPRLDVLKKLQIKHLLSIPFENLDIHNNTQIELSIDRVFEKIVIQNRGGFCYELNGIFFELLIALNFSAKRISARVFNKNKGYGEEFDHFAIIVSFNDEEYLVDVGFGDFTFEPLKLVLDEIQNDKNGEYIIDKYDDRYFRVNKVENGNNTPEYIFKTDKRALKDYREMCIYHQTSPNSHFTIKRLISLPTENGRITISGNKLKITEFGSTSETEIKSETEFKKLLNDLFNIK